MIDSTPRFLNGAFAFHGTGYAAPKLLDPSLVYQVPADKRTQMIYLRAGNSCAEMICVSMMQDGKPVRLFPIGAKGATNVPLSVVEDLPPDTKIELFLSAPEGVSGTVIVDCGMLEI